MDSNAILIVAGAGNAGSELAITARQLGWEGRIILLGDEVHLPYHRPPLSKAYLVGKSTAESLQMRSAEAYENARIELKLGMAIESLDPQEKRITLSDGSQLSYGKLALCLGGRPRTLPLPGLAEGKTPSNLYCLRSQSDSDAIRARLKVGTRLVIIGGGYIGLEVAASARILGTQVTLLEAQSRVLARVTGAVLSEFYEQVHRHAGVDLRTGVSSVGVRLDATGDAIEAVLLADGEVPADFVVVGAGMVANTELADAAGLDVDGGIVVDEFARTSDEHIFAAGDCTVQPSAIYGRSIRLESVPNALEQARAAAAALCGKPKAYNPVPWFWSDQYDLKLQMVGLSQGYDEFVLRGDIGAKAFTGFYLKRGRLIAADSINRPADFMMSKRLVAAGLRVEARRLEDEGIPLKEFLVQ